MKPKALLPLVGGHFQRARTYEQILFYDRRSEQLRTERGELVVRLRHIADMIGASKASVSRYLKWLSEHGFIAIRREYRGSACILLIRVLARPLKRWLQRRAATGCNGDETGMKRYTPDTPHTPGNSYATAPRARSDREASVTDNPSVKSNTPPPKAPLPTTMRMSMLRGKVAGAAGRMAQRKEHRRAQQEGRAPTPTEAAHEWNAVLREWGDTPFHVDPKTLSHVKRTLAHVQPSSLSEFRARLEKAVEWWFIHHAQFGTLKGKPAHPWVLNRNLKSAFAVASPAPVKEEAKPQTPIEPSVASEPPKYVHKGNSLLAMFKAGKKSYKDGDPDDGEA